MMNVSVIATTIRAVRSAATEVGESYEVIVVDDASSYGVAAVVETADARVVGAELRQIAGARNAGAAVARGDILVFVDADMVISAAAVRGAVEAISCGAVGGGSAVAFDEPTPAYVKLFVPLILWFYRRLRLAGGCFLFCTRQAFQAVGGFAERMFAAEEVAMSLALRKQGRFVILRDAVVTSGRKLRTYSGWEILGTMIRLALGGPRALRDRSRLEMWYGPRRKDPSSAA